MTEEPQSTSSQQADGVYAIPAAAEAEAQAILTNSSATDHQRAAALATLGRAAYYANRIDDAVDLLNRALPLAGDASSRADVVLTLAPALSKAGRASEALSLLDMDVTVLSDEQAGKLLNQQGIIFIETGQLREALDAFSRACAIHRSVGDAASEGRVLVNMAAAASELGELAQSEAWYADAWTLNKATGQEFASAIIEGNLGYVASRRGDFSAAIEWYQRGRASFSELGDVDLLLAVLETDYAITLLDLGLNDEAYEAAEFARASSNAGSNRMLETQALLLRGEAELRLGHYNAAVATLDLVNEMATALGVEPYRLRSRYLRSRLELDESETDQIVELAAGLGAAGWGREALRTLVVAAHSALDRNEIEAARQLLGGRDQLSGDGDLIDHAHADAIEALLDGDEIQFRSAIEKGEQEVERQRFMLTTAELQTRIGHRTRSLRSLALVPALTATDPQRVLETLDRTSVSGRRTLTERDAELRSSLRDVRVGVQEAKLNGAPSSELLARATDLERELRNQRPADSPAPELLADLVAKTEGGCFIQFFSHAGQVYAVSAADSSRLTALCSIEDARRAIRSQRTAIRRMASGDERSIERAAAANQRLSQLLLEPLEVPDQPHLGLAFDAGLSGISWSGLEAFSDRDLYIGQSFRHLIEPSSAVAVEHVAFVESGELPSAMGEIDSLEAAWTGTSMHTHLQAHIDDLRRSFELADLVHVAAHGTFRTDNPFFSSLKLADDELTLIDLESIDSLPAVISLASCDSGAASLVGGDLIGTTDVLLALGARIVVAASLIIDDDASSRLVADLHRNLADGESPARSARRARRSALARNTPQDIAAAMAFSIHGDSAATRPLQISRI